MQKFTAQKFVLFVYIIIRKEVLCASRIFYYLFCNYLLFNDWRFGFNRDEYALWFRVI